MYPLSSQDSPAPLPPPADTPVPVDAEAAVIEITDTPAEVGAVGSRADIVPQVPAPSSPLVEPPVLVSPPVLSAPPAGPLPEPFIFHGKAAEYFRIWIVNTLLTLLTLGIFSAWAKVRKRRYLRGCTELLGHRFDYRANPRRILIGNLLMLVFFLGYSLFGVVYPAIRYGVIALAVVMLPWIVVRSLTFNAHNTAYRGLRFRFNQSLSGAALVYLLWPLLIGGSCVLIFLFFTTGITATATVTKEATIRIAIYTMATFTLFALVLGGTYPAWVWAKRNYVVQNHRLGDAYFRFTAGKGRIYAAYAIGGAMAFGGAMCGGVLTTMITTLRGGTDAESMNLIMLIPIFLCYGLGIFTARQFIYGWNFNHIWNHTWLDEHRFIANLSIGRWLGLQFTNLGAIIISVGLLYPWSVVRTQRYTASCLKLIPSGSIDTIRRFGETKGNAVGDTAADLIGLDFGL